MRASQPHSRFGASALHAVASRWVLPAGEAGRSPLPGTGGESPGILSAATGCPEAPRGHALLGRFLPRALAGAFGLRPLSGALVLALALAGCEADHIGAKDELLESGYTGVGVMTGPMFGRPCRVGQPYAVRFTAHDATGAPRSGWLCASDEFAHDGRIFLDEEGA